MYCNNEEFKEKFEAATVYREKYYMEWYWTPAEREAERNGRLTQENMFLQQKTLVSPTYN